MRDGWVAEDVYDAQERDDALDEAEADGREERAEALVDARDLAVMFGVPIRRVRRRAWRRPR
jgi:hypothetical protein